MRCHMADVGKDSGEAHQRLNNGNLSNTELRDRGASLAIAWRLAANLYVRFLSTLWMGTRKAPDLKLVARVSDDAEPVFKPTSWMASRGAGQQFRCTLSFAIGFNQACPILWSKHMRLFRDCAEKAELARTW